jgi:predicted secreted hydrolase
LPAGDFALDLEFSETQPVLLQGKQGLSRKGPAASQASYYYSLPQLATRGTLSLKGQPFAITGKAWLDHEWSEALLHPDATGWDWIGMNLDDGSALTAFRLRDKQGNALWDGGSFRAAGAQPYIFSRGEVIFQPVRRWKSPLSQASYPVEWVVRTPADFYTVRAVIDNQELDSRQSTGAIYWEGLSELIDSNGKKVGRGYLEMTGYASPLRL